MPLSVTHCRRQIETFLAANNLRLEPVDYYACVFRLGNDEEILAGGGLHGDVIKCVAVGQEIRDEGFSARLISHLISESQQRGFHSVKVFTKPENQTIFESIGFHTIARSPDAIMLEMGSALSDYCQYLRSLSQSSNNNQVCGVVEMNANPFTRGHLYLLEKAASQVDHLYVIVVREDISIHSECHFSYPERKSMIETGTRHIKNITVVDGSSFQISSATFPTYFLKQVDSATDTHIALDLDIFVRSIAPSLGVSVRFVGSEPADALTSRYNTMMHSILPSHDIRVVEVDRLNNDGQPISASTVRTHLLHHSLSGASVLVPPTTLPHLIAFLATNAMRQELDLTPKPGLIDRHDNGSHRDMDYHTMLISINTLHPFILAIASLSANDPDFVLRVREIGVEAEQAMMHATHGVNTHRGALYALGITVAALTSIGYPCFPQQLSQSIATLASRLYSLPTPHSSKDVGTPSHGSIVRSKYGVKGASDLAMEGYQQLFQQWLPFYHRHKHEPDGLLQTLLTIMSTLDDTNVYYRAGIEGARYVIEESRAVLVDFSVNKVDQMNANFSNRLISPGGSADMLALTILIDTLCS